MCEPYTQEIATGSGSLLRLIRLTARCRKRSAARAQVFEAVRARISYRDIGRSHQGDLGSEYCSGDLFGHRVAADLTQDVSLGCLSEQGEPTTLAA